MYKSIQKDVIVNINKALILLTLTSTLLACSDSSDPVTEPTPEALPIETVINGKALKGVLTNAIVTVYKYVDGATVELTEDELNNADIITDDAGNYTFTIVDYDGPIKIELTPSTDPENPTTMTG